MSDTAALQVSSKACSVGECLVLKFDVGFTLSLSVLPWTFLTPLIRPVLVFPTYVLIASHDLTGDSAQSKGAL